MTRSPVVSSVVGVAMATFSIAMIVTAEEADPLKKRDPFGMRSEVIAMKNPVAATPENVAAGKAIFEGKGLCFKCHGPEGKGNGRLAPFLDPSPRNFTNLEWQKDRADGGLLWIIKNGSEGTGMASMAPSEISVEEAWHVITYIRTFGKP
jgi:mono/diheme cytochrome c family protein